MNGRDIRSLIRLPIKRSISALSTERFTSPVPEMFLCALCRKVAKYQMECDRCGALYCQECSLRLPHSKERRIGNVCIICDANIRLRPPSRLLKKIIGELEMNCKYRDCQEVITLDYLYEHQTFCPFRVVKCANLRTCNSRGVISQFLKVPTPIDSLFACSQKCKMKIEFAGIINKRNKKQALALYRKVLEDNKCNSTRIESLIRLK